MADNEIKMEEKELKVSTEANRQKKAERREAKAARKEANKEEEKKTRPNNIILSAILCYLCVMGSVYINSLFSVVLKYSRLSIRHMLP